MTGYSILKAGAMIKATVYHSTGKDQQYFADRLQALSWIKLRLFSPTIYLT